MPVKILWEPIHFREKLEKDFNELEKSVEKINKVEIFQFTKERWFHEQLKEDVNHFGIAVWYDGKEDIDIQ